MYWSVILLLVAVAHVQVEALIDLVPKKYQMCDGTENTPIKHHATLKKVNSSLIMADGDVSVPFELGEDVTMTVVVDALKDGEWKEYYRVEENGPCKLFNRFGGDMFFDLEEKVGIERGVCPLPKGDFAVKDHPLDFTKLPFKTAPKGTARFTAKLTKGEELLLCIYGELDSV